MATVLRVFWKAPKEETSQETVPVIQVRSWWL